MKGLKLSKLREGEMVGEGHQCTEQLRGKGVKEFSCI